MLYGHSAKVRSRQIFWDCCLAIWIIAWALLGGAVFRLVNTLRGPSEKVADSASSLGNRVDGIQNSLPGFLKDRTENVGAPTDSLENAARSQADAVTHVASILGWSTALIPIVLAVLVAAYFRLRWINQVRGATSLAGSPAWLELLANRAVMHQPLASLSKVSKDPLGDIEAGRYQALAKLELEELGIDPSRVVAKSRSSGHSGRPPS